MNRDAGSDAPSPIRVLIADDHPAVREGLRSLLTGPEMIVVGEAADGEQAIALAQALRPDVLVLDIQMPCADGLHVIKMLREADTPTRILVLTGYDDDSIVFAAIRGGAQGYLLKDVEPALLRAAVVDTHHGRSVLHPSIARVVLHAMQGPVDRENPLTARESTVLQLIAQGCANRTIAARLQISERTVATHVRNILGKLSLASRTQAALYALRIGLVKDGAERHAMHR